MRRCRRPSTQAELNLSYTEIRAPQDGYITQRNVNVGTYAQAGQQIFYLVTKRLVDRRQLQGNPTGGHAPRPSRSRSGSMPTRS